MTQPVFAVADSPWLRALIYLAAAIVIARLVGWLLKRRDKDLAKVLRRDLTAAEKTRYRIVRRLVVATILFVGIAAALWQFEAVSALGRAMLASAVLVAGIIGIAARSPIANLASGIMIAFSQPLRIGDYIRIEEAAGTVEEIHLTYTYIRTADNRRVVIPNEVIASKVIHNYSIVDATTMATVEFAVPVTAPLSRVREAALEVASHVEGRLPDREPTFEVTSIALDEVGVRLALWVHDGPTAARIAAPLRLAVLERLKDEALLGS